MSRNLKFKANQKNVRNLFSNTPPSRPFCHGEQQAPGGYNKWCTKVTELRTTHILKDTHQTLIPAEQGNESAYRPAHDRQITKWVLTVMDPSAFFVPSRTISVLRRPISSSTFMVMVSRNRNQQTTPSSRQSRARNGNSAGRGGIATSTWGEIGLLHQWGGIAGRGGGGRCSGGVIKEKSGMDTYCWLWEIWPPMMAWFWRILWHMWGIRDGKGEQRQPRELESNGRIVGFGTSPSVSQSNCPSSVGDGLGTLLSYTRGAGAPSLRFLSPWAWRQIGFPLSHLLPFLSLPESHKMFSILPVVGLLLSLPFNTLKKQTICRELLKPHPNSVKIGSPLPSHDYFHLCPMFPILHFYSCSISHVLSFLISYPCINVNMFAALRHCPSFPLEWSKKHCLNKMSIGTPHVEM